MIVPNAARQVVAPVRHFEQADAERSVLRAAVAEVGRFIAHLPSADAGGDRGLAASWAALVKLLALGREPLLRDCPRCGQVGMRDATRCGHCWLALPRLDPQLHDPQVAGGGADY